MARLENGLPADDWLMLADVEALFTGHVLDSLADQGIAAYAEPSSAPEATYLGSGRSGGPSDRVMVDRRYRSEARAVLAGLLPELRAEVAESRRQAEDTSWQQIVSGLSSEGVGSRAVDIDDVDGDPDLVTDEWDDVRPEPAAVPADADVDDEHDHYVPPEPPPLPTTDTVNRFAWVGLIGGPAFLILGTLLGWSVDGVAALLAVGAFVGGFVTLVARMKDRPSIDDSGDDGAVV
jgi:hypothetical protein